MIAAAFALVAIVAAPTARPPSAAVPWWDLAGHRAVARIAWDHMTSNARRNAVALLKRASPAMHFERLQPDDPSRYTQAELDRELFVAASTWPDMARSGDLRRYHRATWHYVEVFWRRRSGRAVRVTSIQPRDTIEADERIWAFADSIAAGEGPDSTRAMQLAWVIHLVGDVHQPLHCGSRVTSAGDESDGDSGGNEFHLTSEKNNLHSYWDRTLSRNEPPNQDADEDTILYTERLAALLMGRRPRSGFTQAQLAVNDNFDQLWDWAVDGLRIAQRSVYAAVQRGRRPSESYNEKALRISERAVALAGYRLAALMNVVFR